MEKSFINAGIYSDDATPNCQNEYVKEKKKNSMTRVFVSGSVVAHTGSPEPF